MWMQGPLSNGITWLLHMAVQLYGLPLFSPQVTYQNISWGTAWVNFEVPTFSLLEIMTKNNWSTGDGKQRKEWLQIEQTHKEKEKKKKDNNKDIKKSFLHVFGWNYSQNYSTLMNHQDTLASFQISFDYKWVLCFRSSGQQASTRFHMTRPEWLCRSTAVNVTSTQCTGGQMCNGNR